MATLDRPLHAAEPNSMVVTGPDGVQEIDGTQPLPFSHCIYKVANPGLSIGHYVIEMRAGNDVLAKGEFDIAP